MAKASTENIKNIGNENSYTPEFFEELFLKIRLTTRPAQNILKRTIMLATQAYVRNYQDHVRELPAHEIKKELKKASSNIDKAAESLSKVYTSEYYSQALINNLYDVIYKNYPILHGLLNEIIRPSHMGAITFPAQSFILLAAMADGIQQTLENFKHEKTPNKSEALYHWIMILSAKLEPIIGHKLEQSRYHKGEYISKRKLSDSELLLFIIKPLDPNVTISQIETAIKETRQERHDAPWDNYF